MVVDGEEQESHVCPVMAGLMDVFYEHDRYERVPCTC